MSQRPIRQAVLERASTHQLAAITTRRSSAQVREDEAALAAAAEAAAVQAQQAQLEKQQRVADIEDDARRQEQLKEKNLVRPDLVKTDKRRVSNRFYILILAYTLLLYFQGRKPKVDKIEDVSVSGTNERIPDPPVQRKVSTQGFAVTEYIRTYRWYHRLESEQWSKMEQMEANPTWLTRSR